MVCACFAVHLRSANTDMISLVSAFSNSRQHALSLAWSHRQLLSTSKPDPLVAGAKLALTTNLWSSDSFPRDDATASQRCRPSTLNSPTRPFSSAPSPPFPPTFRRAPPWNSSATTCWTVLSMSGRKSSVDATALTMVCWALFQQK